MTDDALERLSPGNRALLERLAPSREMTPEEKAAGGVAGVAWPEPGYIKISGQGLNELMNMARAEAVSAMGLVDCAKCGRKRTPY